MLFRSRSAMGKKLLALDIDGTSVCDDYSMGETSKRAIQLAQKKGCIVAFVSGRREMDMLTLKEDQWITDYQILNTGGKIIRCADKKILYDKRIPSEVCKKLISYCMENGLQIQWCNGLKWYVSKRTDATAEYAKEINLLPKVVDVFEKVDFQEKIESFMAAKDWERVAAYIDSSIFELTYTNSEPGSIDIIDRNITKWQGIEILANELGIAYEDIITVGNYYNDLDMLQRAAVGIAVGNAVEIVKNQADFVMERDNNHDVVEEIVTKMLNHEFDL